MKIHFNSDENFSGGALTKDEKGHYLYLCALIISVDDYSINTSTNQDITARILEFVKKEAHSKVDELKNSEEKKAEIHAKIEIIFSTTDPTDTNFIGRINIVCFQCILLFTFNCLDGLSEEDTRSKFLHVFSKKSYDIYKLFMSINYLDYKEMLQIFNTQDVPGFSELYFVKDIYEDLP